MIAGHGLARRRGDGTGAGVVSNRPRHGRAPAGSGSSLALVFDHPYTFIRNPNRPPIVDDMPALVQWDDGETVLDQFAGAPQLRMTVSVEVYDATKDDGAALNEGFR